mmetsp:Transcript_44199/g.32183  ORF Transcript_44199/g.32183 Transcript_44199/m.32183 type:complete len:115 (-) Transcript_44199:145-489(-)
MAVDDLPPFRASMMDGYAIVEEEGKVGVVLEVVESGLAGVKSIPLDQRSYSANSAVYVTTGGPVPSHFDCVLPIEETDLVSPNQIKVKKQMSAGQFIRAKGSDIAKGAKVLEKG